MHYHLAKDVRKHGRGGARPTGVTSHSFVGLCFSQNNNYLPLCVKNYGAICENMLTKCDCLLNLRFMKQACFHAREAQVRVKHLSICHSKSQKLSIGTAFCHALECAQ